MHDLPLEGIHRRQGLSLAAAPDLLGHARTKLAQVGPALRTEATDVEHQPSPAARLPVHCEPGQLLQSVKHLAAFADELVQRRADNRDDGAIALNIHVDVAVEVSDIKQTFDVVSRYLALELQISCRRLGRPVRPSLVHVASLVRVTNVVRVTSRILIDTAIIFIRDVREVFGTAVG
jgi:hypothetical protein